MVGRGSPRLNILLSKAGLKKNSPKASSSKKHGGSPKEKLRASWNAFLEKTLVDLLHEHKTSDYRGQNGWTSEAWNKIVKEFHERENYVFFTKAQIQEKEKELKRDYKVLKEAKKQSGVHWDEKIGKITADPAAWNNIIHSNPRAKKFRSKTFPLFEALGELYDGQTAEGTYNYTSTQQDSVDLTKQDSVDLTNTEVLNLEDTVAYHEQDDADERIHEVEPEDTRTSEEELLMSQRRAADVTRTREEGQLMKQRRDAEVTREEKEPKRQKKSEKIEGMMQSYINFRTKQAEEEAALLVKEREEAQLAREREAQLAREREERESRQANDFSIKKCISALSKMDVTKQEKAKAYSVFKDPDNRQIFLSACDDDAESALIWLKNEMA